MKWRLREPINGLIMAIFKLLVLSYMHTTIIFFILLFEQYGEDQQLVLKYKKEFESTTMGLTQL